ncbi:MAG: hypothetical protein Q8O09_04765, partial [Bacillota bacterium]|nr:hypothetical protein [Bacillota bacterium]
VRALGIIDASFDRFFHFHFLLESLSAPWASSFCKMRIACCSRRQVTIFITFNHLFAALIIR